MVNPKTSPAVVTTPPVLTIARTIPVLIPAASSSLNLATSSML